MKHAAHGLHSNHTSATLGPMGYLLEACGSQMKLHRWRRAIQKATIGYDDRRQP
jgi:hypothetical protein